MQMPSPHPFVLSLSKGVFRRAPIFALSPFDELRTNGFE